MPQGQSGRFYASRWHSGELFQDWEMVDHGQKLTLDDAVVGVMRALKCNSEYLFNYAMVGEAN